MNCLKSQNQCINTLLFPGTLSQSTYQINTFQDLHNLSLLYIPFKRSSSHSFPFSCNYLTSAPDYIPALLALSSNKNCSLFCIHFHGNACDVGQINICASRESQVLNAHYLIIEYPGYGISHGSPNEVVFNEIAIIVHEFVMEVFQIPSQQIVIIGRSIGTGPACYLAGYLQSIRRPPFALIIQSPFASIADATSDLLGFLSYCLLNRWENHYYLVNDVKLATTIQVPVLFIHADQDKIINIAHSQCLHEQREKLGLPSSFYIQKSDDAYIKGHNYFDYEKDVVQPMKRFLVNLLQENEARLQQQQSNQLEHEYTNLHKFIPLIIKKDILKIHATVPPSYVPQIPKSALTGGTKKEQLWSRDVYYEQKKSVCKPTDILGWCCCPAVFCTECSCALTSNALNKCVYCLFPFTKPAFEYQKLRPDTVKPGSLTQLLFRNQAFVKKMNEEDSSKGHTVQDKTIKDAKRRNPNPEIQNPLLENATVKGDQPPPSYDDLSGKPSPNSSEQAYNQQGEVVADAVKLGRDGKKGGLRPTRSTSPTIPPSITINSFPDSQSPNGRHATDQEAKQEEQRRSVNSPSEAKKPERTNGKTPIKYMPG